MPFVNGETRRRRTLIYEFIDKDLSLLDINSELEKNLEKKINKYELNVWRQFLHPIAKSDKLFKEEIIVQGRSLQWVARELKKRYSKQTVS